MKQIYKTIVALALIVLVLPVCAQDFQVDPSEVSIGAPEYSPYLDQGWPNQVYFDDTLLA